MTRLQEVQEAVADHMEKIQGMFKAGARITVLVRQPNDPEGKITREDIEAARRSR